MLISDLTALCVKTKVAECLSIISFNFIESKLEQFVTGLRVVQVYHGTPCCSGGRRSAQTSGPQESDGLGLYEDEEQVLSINLRNVPTRFSN